MYDQLSVGIWSCMGKPYECGTQRELCFILHVFKHVTETLRLDQSILIKY